MIALNEINLLEKVTILKILPSPITDKLKEMGLYKDKVIFIKFKAPLGDPIAIQVDGCLLSLRLSEAQLIIVNRDI